MSYELPPDFVLGAATAAYQIEGATRLDGRTDSIWDTFCRIPGAVVGGDDGSVACDHYHRFLDDVAVMAELGLDSYRFSTSWARVCPGGGAVNPRGIDFYSRLVDALLEQDIAPWLTLYHWDLPQALEDRGGWRNRDTAYRFADFALAVHDRLGDRVPVWTTLNEPWCSAFLGYVGGEHAPGAQDPAAGVAAAHHLLLAHGLAVGALRERDSRLRLGITLNLTVARPLDPGRPGDVEAARRIDGQMNRLFLDPLFRGSYPADVVGDLAGLGLAEHVRDGDLALISAPIDLLGVNYYRGEAVGVVPPEATPAAVPATRRRTRSPFPAADGVHVHSQGLPVTAMGWEIQPSGLTELLVRLQREYTGPAGVPLYVTENGAAFDDEPLADGTVPDHDRAEFMLAHLTAVGVALDAGVDVRGFFYWSLLDNFEWAWGYAKRFGLVRVDYQTQQRTIKESGRLFAAVIASRRVPPPGMPGRVPVPLAAEALG